MWKKAIEDALQVTRHNIDRFGGRFPHVSNGDEHYMLNDNTEWTAGFWQACSGYARNIPRIRCIVRQL